MPFVLVGALLVALKLAEIGPFGACPWWLAVAPLVVAMAWWSYADRSGLNKRREMARLQMRREQRRREVLTGLGMGPDAERERREAEQARAARQREIDRIEGQRAQKRARVRDSILGSRLDGDPPSRHTS